LPNVPTFEPIALLEALPVAVYTTDPEGRITFYNEAAAELWGFRPELGSSQWCGSWRLRWPDGQPMPHGECPMAVALKQGKEMRGAEAVAERPDGTRVPFAAYPTLLRDDEGRVTGAINLLVDLGERKMAEIDRERLAAIVSSSNDAIISKTLDGCITSWNSGATRIFGYEPEEMIGRPILDIIPPELHEQEAEILSRLRRGERIEHFDTVRIAKDGRRIDISLAVSPLRDSTGRIVGASKVGRDISERKRHEEFQRLLFDELNHRVKNTLATIQAIASQSLRLTASPEAFVASFNGRVRALARAHDLLVQGRMKGADVAELVREQVVLGAPSGGHVEFSGPHVTLDPRLCVQLAMVLHELATNARKHGAMSQPGGRLTIAWRLESSPERRLLLEWRERGVPIAAAPASRGFGTTLIERSLESNGGSARIEFGPDGLRCDIVLPLNSFETGPQGSPLQTVLDGLAADFATDASELQGRRVLLVEDEPLVAMDLEAQLAEAGVTVVGPAPTVAAAKRLLAKEPLDAAVLDANLAGASVAEVAAALDEKGTPFLFATGYGPEGLPGDFRDRPVLTKPIPTADLLGTLRILLEAAVDARRTHQFRTEQTELGE
jgi:PAS domain S-box-containing protein